MIQADVVIAVQGVTACLTEMVHAIETFQDGEAFLTLGTNYVEASC